MRRYYDYPNRTLCAVLDEMRKCCETGNYSYLPGLIEEVQSLGNRMEAALHDQDDLYRANKHLKKLKEEIRKLEKQNDKVIDHGEF